MKNVTLLIFCYIHKFNSNEPLKNQTKGEPDMRKSSTFIMLLFAALFLTVCVAFALTGTLANEVYAPEEYPWDYGGGKVVPPGWCLEHGYIATRNPDNPLVCILCD